MALQKNGSDRARSAFLGATPSGASPGKSPRSLDVDDQGYGTSKTIEKQEKIKGHPARWRSQGKAREVNDFKVSRKSLAGLDG
jgi:hypothetical protein